MILSIWSPSVMSLKAFSSKSVINVLLFNQLVALEKLNIKNNINNNIWIVLIMINNYVTIVNSLLDTFFFCAISVKKDLILSHTNARATSPAVITASTTSLEAVPPILKWNGFFFEFSLTNRRLQWESWEWVWILQFLCIFVNSRRFFTKYSMIKRNM